MATTIHWCDGAESQDLTWAISQTGVTNVTSNPRTGTQCYLIEAGDSITLPMRMTAGAGLLSAASNMNNDDITFAFGIRVTTKPVTTASKVATVIDSNTNVILTLQIETNGDLVLIDNALTTLTTVSDPFSLDVYHFVEMYFEQTGTGDWEIRIDDVLKDIGFNEGVFNVSGQSAKSVKFEAENSLEWRLDDYCVHSDNVVKPQFLTSNVEVLAFQAGSGATATGSLDSGSVTDIDDLPHVDTGNSTELSITISGGRTWSVECDAPGEGQAGPSGSPDIDGDSNIKVVVWHHQLKRTSGSQPTSMNSLHGNDTDSLVAANRASLLTTAYQNFFITSDDASVAMPLSTEHLEYGIEIVGGSGGRDLFCSGIFAQLLHVKDESVEISNINILINQAVQRAANF